MNPFLTVYRKDFDKKPIKRYKSKGVAQEFSDPVGEGFKNYLQLNSKKPPPKLPTEDADGYLNKFEQKQPKLAKIYFQTPINDGEITEAFIYNGRSVYQVDYCDIKKDQEYKEEQIRKNLFRLSEDCYIPLTTQKYWFRDPLLINSRAMERVPQIRVPNNLDPDHRLREILKITTGESEYTSIVGNLGELVMNEELHGKVVHPECND